MPNVIEKLLFVANKFLALKIKSYTMGENVINQALLVAQSAEREINNLLSEPVHAVNRLEIAANFRRIYMRLQFMGAVLETPKADINGMMPKDPFPPITNFMGDEIRKADSVTVADLSPQESARQVFLAKVQKLWNDLPLMGVESVLMAYTLPEDILVLRGVAKRANVKDYDSRELNQEFIEDIILGIDIVNEEKGKQSLIDKNASKNALPVTLTEDMINADPELKKLKAKPGDILSMGEKGQKIITTPKANP